jgi:hypothetical protein
MSIIKEYVQGGFYPHLLIEGKYEIPIPDHGGKGISARTLESILKQCGIDISIRQFHTSSLKQLKSLVSKGLGS